MSSIALCCALKEKATFYLAKLGKWLISSNEIVGRGKKLNWDGWGIKNVDAELHI